MDFLLVDAENELQAHQTKHTPRRPLPIISLGGDFHFSLPVTGSEHK
jgi:hypothetical protein